MPDVAKLKKRALEYEQKKQFDKALDTYTLVLAELDEHVDEADVALFNRVGDLLLRRGDVSSAVDHYEKAVDLYTDGGFFNNAIALCNKILRNAPGRNSVYYKLGKISARKGFINDAKQNFLEYADRMQKAGKLEEAFRALKEFADLCPDQDDIRLMLADQLVRKDRKVEAIEQLQALYEKFSAEGRTTEARATVDRMKALDPALEPKEVVRAPTGRPRDLVFLDVNYDEPARTPVARTDAPAADKTAWTVVHPTTTSGTPAVEIEMPQIDADEDILIDLEASAASEVAQLPGLSHGAILPEGIPEVGDGIVSHVDLGLITGFENSELAGPEANSDVAPLAEIEQHSHVDSPSSAPDGAFDYEEMTPVPGLELDEGMLTMLHDEEPLGGDLPMLDMSFGNDDEESIMGTALPFISLDPTSEATSAQPPRESLAVPEAFLDLELDVERSPTLEMDVIVPDGGPPRPIIENVEEEPPPRFGYTELDVMLGDYPHDPDEKDRESALSGLPMLDPESEADELLAPLPSLDDEVEETVELVWQAAPADEPEQAEVEPPAPAPPPSRTERLRAEVARRPAAWDLHRQLAEALLEEGDRAEGMMELEATMFGYEHDGNLAAASRSAEELIRVEPNSVRYHQKRVEYAVRANDKLQLVDAYLALAESLFRSGQLDKSRAVYGRVLELSPLDARASSALRELGVEIEPPAPPMPPAALATPAAAAAPVVEERAQPPLSAPTPEEEEEEPPRLAIDEDLFVTLENALPEPRLREPPVIPPAASSPRRESFVNLSEWLREDEPPESTRVAENTNGEQPTEQAEFEEMLSKFKQGVTANVEETDHESHYDLGMAYREMGLLDEAISEFQKALRGTEHRVRTYEALGQCFVEKRQYQIAMTILMRALNDASASDELLVGVLYLLGYASESLQKWEDAVGYYERVFTVDIQFRDVGDRLATVERKLR